MRIKGDSPLTRPCPGYGNKHRSYHSDSAGVDTTSDFVVKTSTSIDPKIVAKNISIQLILNLLGGAKTKAKYY